MAVETLFRKGAIIYKQDAFKPFSSQCSHLIPHGCFSRFLNCSNGTKSRNASLVQIAQCITCALASKLRT